MDLTCHYCVLKGRRVLASVTVHDRRGCLNVCWDCAIWRSTTSGIFGHAPGCPIVGVKK